jgi:hypothetical protein
MKIHVALLMLSLVACEKSSSGPAAPAPEAPAGAAAETAVATPAASQAAETAGTPSDGSPTFDTMAPCGFLNTEQVAGTLGLGRGDAVAAAPDGKDRGHRKRCRYTWKTDGGVQGSLVLDIAAKREGPAGARFDEAVEKHRAGLPVMGREGVTQRFTAENGLGDEVLYSGNVPDMKALFARFGDRYLVSLQHEVHGTDTGDLKAKLMALGRAVAKKLAKAGAP